MCIWGLTKRLICEMKAAWPHADLQRAATHSVYSPYNTITQCDRHPDISFAGRVLLLRYTARTLQLGSGKLLHFTEVWRTARDHAFHDFE